MNYTNKSFNVCAPGTDQYRENWERTFRTPACGDECSRRRGVTCQLPRGHEGAHEASRGDTLSETRTYAWE